MNLIPPNVYHPRAVVIVHPLFDDQVSPGVPSEPFDVIPRSVDVQRNDARHADTCIVELDYRDFPIDPRLVGGLQIQVHIDDLLDPALPLIPTRLNLRFIGNVDEPETTFGSDGETVRFEARDFTAIWISRSWRSLALPVVDPVVKRPIREIFVTQPLGVLVEQFRLAVAPASPPAVFAPTAAAAAGILVNTKTGRSTWTTGENDTAWDVLVGMCELFGLVPVYELDILTIRSATEIGPVPVQMLYGHNVERLTFRRNLRRPEEKAVRIVAWNPALGQSMTAEWPPTPQTALESGAGPAGAPAPVAPPTTRKVTQYSVEGPYTPVTLLATARQVQQELSQSKIEGQLETRDMGDFVGLPLTGLKNGDHLDCRLMPDLETSIIGMSPAEAIAFLSDPLRVNAMTPAVATILVAAWTAVQQLATRFYVSEARHSWHRSDGYRLTIKFRAFILGA